jgi:hypothetical protein
MLAGLNSASVKLWFYIKSQFFAHMHSLDKKHMKKVVNARKRICCDIHTLMAAASVMRQYRILMRGHQVRKQRWRKESQ